MVLLYDKTYDDLVSETEAELKSNNFSTTPGSLAKLFLNVINNRQSEYYDILRVNHAQAFLSSSSGDFLDEVGKLLACKRYADEDDDTYRYRISNQTLTAAKANETAIRLAALSVSGVNDIVMNKYTFGSGSFTMYVIGDSYNVSDDILSNVSIAVDEVVAYGIKYLIANPKFIEVSLKIKLLFKSNITDSRMQELRINVRNSIKNYLTTRNIGDSIITNEITRLVMSTSTDILNYSVSEFKINNAIVNFNDQYIRSNERFVLSSSQDELIVN